VAQEGLGMTHAVLESELTVLRRYRDGAVIEKADQNMINRLSSIGLLKMGLDLETMRETTKPTAMGNRLIEDIKY
jgi:hypothetical protein